MDKFDVMQHVGPEFDLGNMADLIATETGINPHNTREVLAKFAELLPQALVKYSRVELSGLGVFRLKMRAARAGVFAGQAWETPERVQVRFKAAPAVCRVVADGLDTPAY